MTIGINLFLSLMITLLIGWLIFSLFFNFKRFNLPLQLCFSFLIGIGLISLQLFLYFLLGIKFTKIAILSPWLVLAFFEILFFRKKMVDFRFQGIFSFKNFSKLEWLLLAIIVLEIFYSGFRALIEPIQNPDAIGLYAIKAKVFYYQQTIPMDFFKSFTDILDHQDYPLLIPLYEAFVAIFMNQWHEQLIKIIFPLFLLNLIIIFGCSLGALFNRLTALLFCCLLVTLPRFNILATWAICDLPLTSYYCLGFLTLFLFFRYRDLKLLFLSFLFSLFACWTKNEGMMLALVNCFIGWLFLRVERKNLFKREKISVFLGSLIVIGFIISWLIFVLTQGIRNDVVFTLKIEIDKLFLEKLGMIFYFFQKEIFNPLKAWNILWVVFGLTLVIYPKLTFKGDNKYLLLSIFMVLGGYFFIYLFETHYFGLYWHLATSLNRLLAHIVPLVLFFIINIYNQVYKIKYLR